MGRKLVFWLLWVGFLGYAFLLAPPDQPDTLALIQKLSTGDWEGINPAIIALFNIMGVWPLVYACVALIDGHNQSVKAWIFVAGSFAVGAFALLPYLALRQPQPEFQGAKSWFIKVIDSRWVGAVTLVGAIALLTYGLTAGDWSDFARQWQTSRFIHVMSLDFCLLSALFPVLLRDDMARRGLQAAWIFWAVSVLPLVGPALYLSLRPPLPQAVEPVATTVATVR